MKKRIIILIAVIVLGLLFSNSIPLFSTLEPSGDEDFRFKVLQDNTQKQKIITHDTFFMGNNKIAGSQRWACADPNEKRIAGPDSKCLRGKLLFDNGEYIFDNGETKDIHQYISVRYVGSAKFEDGECLKRETIQKTSGILQTERTRNITTCILREPAELVYSEANFFFDIKPGFAKTSIGNLKDLISLNSLYAANVVLTNNLPSGDFIIESIIEQKGFFTGTKFETDEFIQDKGFKSHFISVPTEELGLVEFSVQAILKINNPSPSETVTLKTLSPLTGNLIFATGDVDDGSYTIKEEDALTDFSSSFIPFENKIFELKQVDNGGHKLDEDNSRILLFLLLTAAALLVLMIAGVRFRK